jgi:uncharacterized membrane protein
MSTENRAGDPGHDVPAYAPPVDDTGAVATGGAYDQPVNVGQAERLGSAAVGALLALYGLSRRSIGGLLLAAAGGALVYRGIKGHCPVYESIGMDTSDEHLGEEATIAARGIHVREVVTVRRKPEDVYAYWRDVTRLPSIMSHLEKVTRIDDRRSHWSAKAPAGMEVTWDAEITVDSPNEMIAWHSVPGAQVPNSGSVRFAPAEDGEATEVRVTLDYIPPAGRVGALVARLFGEEPSQQLADDLDRFKSEMERAS